MVSTPVDSELVHSFIPTLTVLFKNNNLTPPVKVYPNADLNKQELIKENKNKSGVLKDRWVNNINGKSYVVASLGEGPRW